MSTERTGSPGSQGFEAMALPLLDSLYRTARTLTGNEADARDLVQTTYLKALQRFGDFRAGSNGKAWMMRIMRNTWIDQLRHRKVTGPELPLEEEWLPAGPEAPAGSAPLEDMLEQFSDAEVISALMELPEHQRMALFLSDVEGLAQEQIAEVLEVATGTVKSRVSRARAVLRQKLEGYARQMGFLERRPCRT